MGCLGFLHIQPSELKLPFELRKQSLCSMQLTSKTDEYVAFKVKTTSPKKYCVRPNAGIISPGMTCNVTVTMQAQKELPHDMHCKDKFLIQTVVVPKETTDKDINSEMFNKGNGKVVEEFKLRVVYIPANPPSPIPEESDEGYSPRFSVVDDESQSALLVDSLNGALEKPKDESSFSQTGSTISKLTEEKHSVVEQNLKLQQELEVLRREKRKRVSMLVVSMVALLGVLVGYLVNNRWS